MAEPDIYTKFAELYIKHERLKERYEFLCAEIAVNQVQLPSSHDGSNAEYLLEQEDV